MTHWSVGSLCHCWLLLWAADRHAPAPATAGRLTYDSSTDEYDAIGRGVEDQMPER